MPELENLTKTATPSVAAYSVAAEAVARTEFGLPFVRASLSSGVVIELDILDEPQTPAEHQRLLQHVIARLMPMLAEECVGDHPWRRSIDDDAILQQAALLTYVVGDAFDGDGHEWSAWLEVARARAERLWDGRLRAISSAATALEAGDLTMDDCRRIITTHYP